MARGKITKKDSLTIEERLEQALVPDWEQPYKVPENWVWTKVSNIAEVIMGQSPSGSDTTSEITEFGLIGGAADMGEIYPVIRRYTLAPTKLSKPGDVILSIRATLGRPIFSDGVYCLGRGVAAIRSKMLSKELLRFFYLNFEHYLYEIATGTTFSQVNSEQLNNMIFPFPPLAEQQRIVDRIESLFAKLDEAKEKAQAALDSFETQKAAILHMAFTGELTNLYSSDINKILQAINEAKTNLENRKKIQKQKNFAVSEHDSKYSPPKNWVIEKIGNVAFVTKLAGFEYTKYINLQDSGEIPVLRAQNVRKGYLDIANLKFISSEISNILTRSALEKTSILITFIGAGIGDVCIFDKQERYHLAPNIAKVEIYNEEIEVLLSKFILYYLLSSFGQEEIFKNMKSTAQPSLSMETIRDIIIPIAPTAEQTEIVRILDSIFEKEQQAKELASVIEKIDLMKKAILARAFRGELGTNDPNEESSIGLLQEILVEKHPETKTRTQATLIPKNVDAQLKTHLEREVYRTILKNETVDMDILFGVTKNFNELMIAVNALEKKGLIKKLDGRYWVK